MRRSRKVQGINARPIRSSLGLVGPVREKGRMLRTEADPELRVFDPAIRFLHWLTLFLVAGAFVLAFSIDLASSKEEAATLVQLHRSFGVSVWVVTLGRLVWRQFSRFPNWPADMPQV